VGIPCPYCESETFAGFVKGKQISPYSCLQCDAVEIGMTDEDRGMSKRELETGWWEPGRELPETSDDEKHINHYFKENSETVTSYLFSEKMQNSTFIMKPGTIYRDKLSYYNNHKHQYSNQTQTSNTGAASDLDEAMYEARQKLPYNELYILTNLVKRLITLSASNYHRSDSPYSGAFLARTRIITQEVAKEFTQSRNY